MSNLRRDARCLIRQREPIHCYWQLFLPTLFNELHKASPACIATIVQVPVEACRPHFASGTIIDVENFSRKDAKKIGALLSAFAPRRDIILFAFEASVASHVALNYPISASCFGRNLTLWLQSLRN